MKPMILAAALAAFVALPSVAGDAGRMAQQVVDMLHRSSDSLQCVSRSADRTITCIVATTNQDIVERLAAAIARDIECCTGGVLEDWTLIVSPAENE